MSTNKSAEDKAKNNKKKKINKQKKYKKTQLQHQMPQT